MAELTIVAASVLEGTSGIETEDRLAGATITAGQLVYLDSGTNTYKPTDANGSLATATIRGVALNGAASGQTVRIQRKGRYTVGSTVVVGTIYVAGATLVGSLAPSVDLVSGWYVSILGVAVTAAIIDITIVNSGALTP